MDGWIKLHRCIMEDEWYHKEKFTHEQAWIDLLLLAAHKPQKQHIRGIPVNLERGQIALSIRDLAARWKWSTNKVQAYIKKLENVEKIDTQKSNLINVLTIRKYSIYQQADDETLTQTDTQIDTQTDTQTDTQKQKKKSKTKKENNKQEVQEKPLTNVSVKKKDAAIAATPTQPNIEERKKRLYDALIPYVQRYGREMIRDFYDYWTETNRSHTKMRFEQQPTWETPKRLATWAKNEKKYGANHHTGHRDHPTNEQLVADTLDLVATMQRERESGKKAFW